MLLEIYVKELLVRSLNFFFKFISEWWIFEQLFVYLTYYKPCVVQFSFKVNVNNLFLKIQNN